MPRGQEARHIRKTPTVFPAELWHVSERLREPGDEIAVGRWGKRVLESGRNHPSFFREQLLELSRVTWADEAVSRLACTFAFEDLATARQHRLAGEFLYSVVPTSWEPSTRVDMLWISFVGVPRDSRGNPRVVLQVLDRCWHERDQLVCRADVGVAFLCASHCEGTGGTAIWLGVNVPPVWVNDLGDFGLTRAPLCATSFAQSGDRLWGKVFVYDQRDAATHDFALH